MIIQKFFQKIKEMIKNIRVLPYEKRLFILRVSLVSVALVLLILWIGIFKNEVSSNHPLATNEIKAEEKIQSLSKLEIFKKGLYLTYNEHFLPILKILSEGLSGFFSLIVKVVIKLFNITTFVFHQIFIQYKSYAQLIHYIFIR